MAIYVRIGGSVVWQGGSVTIPKDLMYHKFRAYGFLKNLRFFAPFLILFFLEAGLSFFQIGVLFSIREIAINLLEIPTGVVADSCGRRKVMIASFSFYLLSFALFYLSPCFLGYALAMVIFAFGETLRSGTHKAMILEYLRIKGIEDHKVEFYGHTRAASQLGAALAAVIAAGLVFYTGSFRILFLFSIIPCILGLLLIISYPRELDGSLIRLEGNWRVRLVAQIGVTIRDFSSTLRRWCLLRGLASSAFFDAVFKSTEGYLQPILKAQALVLPVLLFVRNDQRVAIVVGGMYFVIHLATSYAAKNAGRVTARAHSLPAAANITCLIGVSLLAAAGLAAALDAYTLSIAAFLGFHLLQNIRRPIMVGYLAGIIPHRTMATGLSVETQLRTLLVAGIAPLAGFLADRIGVGEALAIIAVVSALVSIALRLRGKEQSLEKNLKIVTGKFFQKLYPDASHKNLYEMG